MNNFIVIKGIITSDTVIDAVAKVTGVSRKRMLSNRRLWPLVEARMLSALTLKRLGLPDMKIAWILSRDRSTVCKSRKTAENLLCYYKSFNEKFQQIQTLINTNALQNEN